MISVKNLSIKQKLIAIILFVTTLSLILAFSINYFYVVRIYKTEMVSSAGVTAGLIGETCKFPLAFSDRQGASDILKTIDAIPLVLRVDLYDKKGAVFATYERNTGKPLPVALYQKEGFQKGILHLSKQIIQDGDRLGFISFYLSTSSLDRRIRNSLTALAMIFLVVIVISIGIAARVQLIISRPIHELTLFAGRISEKSDYSLRCPEQGTDEIGTLQKSINHMVGRLEKSIVSLKNEIHDRTLAEQEMIRLRSLLRDIIDSMPSIIIAIDKTGAIMQFNHSARDFSGIDPKAAYQKSLYEIIPLLEPYREIISQTVIEGKQKKIPVFTQTATDGIKHHFSGDIYPLIENSDGGAVVRIDDITEKVNIEAIMIQTEKMMSVGGLAAGMAHEINNPLGIILQAVLNLKRRISKELPQNFDVARESGIDLNAMQIYFEKRKINEYIEGIISSVRRAADIVSNMLQFSRQSTHAKTPSNLADIIKHAVLLAATDYDLKKKYDFRQIEIRYDFDEALTNVTCVATEIEQVFLNILRNAAQAMAGKKADDFHPVITISTKRTGAMARVEIADNGPGIKPEIKNRIFEPFFTTKPIGEGTGLGLSVSYFIIAENHKGTLSVETEYGKGAAFIICLPL